MKTKFLYDNIVVSSAQTPCLSVILSNCRENRLFKDELLFARKKIMYLIFFASFEKPGQPVFFQIDNVMQLAHSRLIIFFYKLLKTIFFKCCSKFFNFFATFLCQEQQKTQQFDYFWTLTKIGQKRCFSKKM